MKKFVVIVLLESRWKQTERFVLKMLVKWAPASNIVWYLTLLLWDCIHWQVIGYYMVSRDPHSTSTTRCIAKINQILYTCQFARLNNLWEASNEITMEVSVLSAAKLPVSTSYWIKLITVNINKISGKKLKCFHCTLEIGS